MRQQDVTTKCAPTSNKMAEIIKTQTLFFPLQACKTFRMGSDFIGMEYGFLLEKTKRTWRKNATSIRIPSKRVILPPMQQAAKNTVTAKSKGNSTFTIFLVHLKGATMEAIPNPSVRFAKLLPKILPNEISGCPLSNAVIDDIKSGADVPNDTKNTLTMIEFTLYLFTMWTVESHKSFAPPIKKKNPARRKNIVERDIEFLQSTNFCKFSTKKAAPTSG
jgi:hypothetical protein